MDSTSTAGQYSEDGLPSHPRRTNQSRPRSNGIQDWSSTEGGPHRAQSPNMFHHPNRSRATSTPGVHSHSKYNKGTSPHQHNLQQPRPSSSSLSFGGTTTTASSAKTDKADRDATRLRGHSNLPHAASTSAASGSNTAPRSHASLPAALPSQHHHGARGAGHGRGGSGGGSRHRDHHDRSEPRYDADFDRSLGVERSSAASGPGPTGSKQSTGPQAATSRLYNPDAPVQPAQLEASHSRRRDRDRASELIREDGTVRRPRSKREPVELTDLGRRVAHRDHHQGTRDREHESKESLESEESAVSAGGTRASGRPGSRASREGPRPRRSRREGGRRIGEDGEALGGASSSSLLLRDTETATHPTSNSHQVNVEKPRQLFDPRRDDPVKFGAGAGSGSANAPQIGRKQGSAANDARSLAASPSAVSLAAPSIALSDVISLGGPTGDDGASASSSSQQGNAIVAQLRRAYREIMDLETKLQDDHKAAMAATAREEENSHGVRIQGGGKRFDDEYWVKLASGHKALADAHYSFLQMALDPRLPASLHSLPQRYNIPTRLWQVAFHQLLERMRHAIVSPSQSHAPNALGMASPANVLEHLIEFIQYAYGHYSQLFEDPAIAVFRAAWIEQLGDLARYRMAVAGLASRVNAAQQQQQQRSDRSTQDGQRQHQQQVDSAESSPEREPRPVDAASIGVAALGDWEVEEQESWRVIARDWYGQGLAETPGTGRLHHHLALLSKGDELRSLYHYTKSLTAAHPYVSARESILPLFEEEHQVRRTQPDVSKAELFVHLHGMLFTKIALDDFDDVLARFLERLEEDGALLRRREAEQGGGVDEERQQAAFEPFGDAEWTMLAVINISAMLQYGSEDGVLRRFTAKEGGADGTGGGGRGGSSAGVTKSSNNSSTKSSNRHKATSAQPGSQKQRAPQAIMLNSSSLKRSGPEVVSTEGGEQAHDSETSPRLGSQSDVVMQLTTSTNTAPEEDPIPFRLAQKLTFSMLELALRQNGGVRRIGIGKESQLVNPYIVLVLTFLGYMAQHAPALRHIERAVPWYQVVTFLNRIPREVEVRIDTPQYKLVGSTLPEDWCIRGMDWSGRHLFGRGFWRTRTPASTSHRDEMAPPPIEAPSGTSATVESEMDALKFDPAHMDNVFEDVTGDDNSSQVLASARLATARWKRVAVLASWLARNVAGLDFDMLARTAAAAENGATRFNVTGSLEAKCRRWKRDDDEAAEAERLSKLSAWQRQGPDYEDDNSSEDETDDEDEDNDDVEDDSPAVKELKARRRQLKAVIKQARQATRGPSASIRRLSSKSKVKNPRSVLKVFPGYSTLVFDTNILLTSMRLLRDLVEAAKWTIVVPLAVITELDGLRRNSSPLGSAATEAIEYLETAVRSHSRYLKIQTSRGNYLRDLSIRSEAIDFSSAGAASSVETGGFSHDFARSMDDVILKAVAWQKDHFTSRLALVNPGADPRQVPPDAAQVVLVTFDRNLRLKAKARGLDAADESGMGLLLSNG